MKTSFKNLTIIIAVTVATSLATIIGYNFITKDNAHSENESYEYLSGDTTVNNFDQTGAIHLTNMISKDGYPDFTVAAENSINAVVHVKMTKTVRGNSREFGPSIEDFLFGFGFGNRQGQGQPQQRTQVGYGSGVIISNDGYIMTNNHVISGANKIEVTLNNNEVVEAKLIGSDPNSDIALLKIEGKNHPFITFGNSDDLKVGEWVLAVGNPFNLTSTVTAGIVSAKNRTSVMNDKMGIQSFIQIDAALNSGNSGGALVNTKGELVGINTAIYSQNGNFTGYGFAVPISLAGKVASDIKEYGMVQRAILGVSIATVEQLKEIDEKKADRLQKVGGAYVADFAERSPAKQAGLKKDDIITHIEGKKIKQFSDLQLEISKHRPGDKIKIVADRDGSKKTFTVTLSNLDGNTEFTKIEKGPEMVGAKFKELSEEQMMKYGVNYGVEVVEIDSKGKFAKEGIKKGFIILRVNNRAITSERDINNIVDEVLQSSESDNDQALYIRGFYPNERTRYIVIDISDMKKKLK